MPCGEHGVAGTKVLGPEGSEHQPSGVTRWGLGGSVWLDGSP